ncbi:MAG: D-glycero-beta-D-manno-heptose 1-phosphate adenylyltransferase [Candidatus Omnitrophica bacterium]|nr:D-glycero-beta-D-manno-heptose 1-phosphate adenylyltransferase [Candidatus Omnitrophota bacterium]MCM8793184.1 D-glycero-beta-D-manno-heptose 1-phosphate adenylyltransferase [Candidatus Omnitrophota bacterium]
MTANKIKTLAQIKKIVFLLRKENKKIVFTNGCFDILHYGHLKYLEKAKGLGDILIVGINRDVSVKAIKGNFRPINRCRERMALVAGLQCVDYCLSFKEKTPARIIREIKPDVLVKGGDWKKEDIVGYKFVKSYGGDVRTIKFLKGYSTTGIIKKIVEHEKERNTADIRCQYKSRKRGLTRL